MFAGKLTVCRTILFAVLIAPLCTRMVRNAVQRLNPPQPQTSIYSNVQRP
jgi:hypothetical protein